MSWTTKVMIAVMLVWFLAPNVLLGLVPMQYQGLVVGSLNTTKATLISIWNIGKPLVNQAVEMATAQAPK